ncbi:MAG TPA: TetR/AcrR family transcriptional regulator [Ktedonobacteraceae bacterium]|jgi:AcrR family transcriptional regulator
METTLPEGNNFATHKQARAQGHELLRRNVVEAASRLLVEEGPEALTVRRVAQLLKCSTKIIYTLFAGKDGLANALYVEGCTRLRRMLVAVPQAALPQLYVQEIARAYWEFAHANPGYYGILFDGAIPKFQPTESSKQVMMEALEAIARILQTYMDQGLLPAQNPEMLARAIWAPLHGVVSLALLGHLSSLAAAKEIFARTIQAMTGSLATYTPPPVA